MTILLGKNACPDREGGWPALARIFRPIDRDLEALEAHLARVLQATTDREVREITEFLLETPGKRIRPALVLLSARAIRGAGDGSQALNGASMAAAVAVELIHMASLVHDDLIDGATVRHHRASVPAKWGKRVSASIGDHLCAQAFQLVADCGDPRLFSLLGAQLAAMCEGELQQVAGRGDFGLCERHCLAVIEKKTASLFGASCGAGATAAGAEPNACQALQTFGFHLGVAFQILDDCKDLLSDRERLGKPPGQDLQVGDVTLPLLYAIQHCGQSSAKPSSHDGRAAGGAELVRIGDAFYASEAPQRIAEWVRFHLRRAAQELKRMTDSDAKASLHQLADCIATSVSCLLAG
jgi:heptaprenyl diphosphate synthase